MWVCLLSHCIVDMQNVPPEIGGIGWLLYWCIKTSQNALKVVLTSYTCFIHKLHNFCLIRPDHKANISICFNESKSLVWPSWHMISVSVLNVRVSQVNVVKHAVVWIKKYMWLCARVFPAQSQETIICHFKVLTHNPQSVNSFALETKRTRESGEERKSGRKKKQRQAKDGEKWPCATQNVIWSVCLE